MTKKDLQDSLKNRTILISLLLPLAASVLFSVLDASQVPQSFTFAVWEQDTEVADFIESHAANIHVQPLQSLEEGRREVERGRIDALLAVESEDTVTLHVDASRPVRYYALTDMVRRLLDEYFRASPGYFLDVEAVTEHGVGQSLLPIWMTLTMTMIGVMVVSGGFAEERESGSMDFILTSPMNLWEVLLGKCLFGVILTFITMVLMLVLNGVMGFGIGVIVQVLLIVLVGAVAFTALGILVGTVAHSQSTARALGTVLYLPLLFPALIHDLSPFTERLASWVPTYYVFRSLEQLLYHRSGGLQLLMDAGLLAITAMLLLIFGYVFLRRVVFHARR